MLKRGYQEDFYTLYKDYQNHDNRLSKGEKALFALKNFSGANLAELSCLDLGCSNGIITSYLQPFFAKMTGLDYDKIAIGMVSPTQKETSSYIRGDAMTLPFSDDSFDVIICAQVYEHVPSDLILFSEMERILKPNGIVFFSGPNRLFPIEPHHYLPFLQWFPPKISDFYLRLTGKGNHFYERSRTVWNLKKTFNHFAIRDVTIPVTRFYAKVTKSRVSQLFYNIASSLPVWLWKVFLPIIPNFNWVLIKKSIESETDHYEIVN